MKLLPILSVDFSTMVDFVINQNDFHSCAANAIVMIFFLSIKKQNFPPFLCSSLFLYYNTRNIMGTTQLDNGCNFDVLFEAIEKYGMIPERMWSIDKDAHLLQRPPDDCFTFAKNNPWDMIIKRIEWKEDMSCISNGLLDNMLILCSIFRYKTQYVDKDGFLCTDYLSPLKPFSHAIVIVGIDAVLKKVICINSQGVEGGINGFFYISFKEFCTTRLVHHSLLYSIKAHFLRNTVTKEILDTHRYLYDMPLQKREEQSQYSWNIWNVSTSFDHVIIGSGITGSYLAHRLEKKYPNDSILIVDENNVKSTTHTLCSTTGNIDSGAYRTELNTMPFCQSLIDEFNIQSEILDHESDVFVDQDPFLLSRLMDNICDYFGINHCMDLVSITTKVRFLSDVNISKTSFNQFLKKYGYNEIEKKQLEKIVQSPWIFDLECPVAYAVFNILSGIIPQPMWVSINYSFLIQKLQKGFSLQSIQELIECSSRCNILLDGYYAQKMTDSHLLLYRRDCQSKQCSDAFQIKYQHLYLATAKNEWLASPPPLQPIHQMRLYLFTKNHIVVNKNDYWFEVGKISYLSPNLIRLNIRDSKKYAFFQKTMPAYIRNGLVYELWMWKELSEWVMEYFVLYDVNQFILYIYPEELLQIPTLSLCNNENQLELIQRNLYLSSNTHWINSNQSFDFCYIEGSLQLVDYFLQSFTK
jgi:hypothetical protein